MTSRMPATIAASLTLSADAPASPCPAAGQRRSPRTPPLASSIATMSGRLQEARNCRAASLLREASTMTAACSMRRIEARGISTYVAARARAAARAASDSAMMPASALPDCDELRGLRDVLAEHELAAGPRRTTPLVLGARRRRRGRTARARGWRWRSAGRVALAQHAEARADVDAAILCASRARCGRWRTMQRAGLGQPGALELPRIVDVGREEDVERRAVLNLREEVAGRAERRPDACGRSAAESTARLRTTRRRSARGCDQQS